MQLVVSALTAEVLKTVIGRHAHALSLAQAQLIENDNKVAQMYLSAQEAELRNVIAQLEYGDFDPDHDRD